jgi:hypothetical protein
VAALAVSSSREISSGALGAPRLVMASATVKIWLLAWILAAPAHRSVLRARSQT